MDDNVVNFTKPKELMPAPWHQHAGILDKTRAEIDALRRRLKKEMRDFLEVMREDMSPIDRLGHRTDVTSDEQKVMAETSSWLDKNVRDALTLLECASERVGYATPGHWCFEYAPAATPPEGRIIRGFAHARHNPSHHRHHPPNQHRHDRAGATRRGNVPVSEPEPGRDIAGPAGRDGSGREEGYASALRRAPWPSRSSSTAKAAV